MTCCRSCPISCFPTVLIGILYFPVYRALQGKGYDPITQLVGFVLTGDPTYITSFQGARSMICRLERDEILEELVRFYVENKLDK